MSNHEGYPDPTADRAVRNVMAETRNRKQGRPPSGAGGTQYAKVWQCKESCPVSRQDRQEDKTDECDL